jgi:hypothetical protein
MCDSGSGVLYFFNQIFKITIVARRNFEFWIKCEFHMPYFARYEDSTGEVNNKI